MSRYLTALLVILTTTGVETQAYQYVLKASLSCTNIENITKSIDLKENKEELISIIKVYKQLSKGLYQTDYNLYLTAQRTWQNNQYDVLSRIYIRENNTIFLLNKSISNKIKIRAPSLFILKESKSII